MAQVQRRRPAKSRAAVAKQSLRDYFIMALVMVVIVGGIIGIKRWRDSVPGVTASGFSTVETYLQGVYVNGMDLGGLTYEQGIEAANQQVADRLNQPINVLYNGQTFTRTPAQMGATMVGLDDCLLKAWQIGHIGTDEQRREAYEFIKEGNEVAFDSTLQVNDEKIDEFVNEIAVHVNVRPVEAEISVDATQLFEVSDHSDGVQVDEAELRQDITSAIYAGGAQNINLVPKIWRPENTTEIANAMKFKIAEAKTNAASKNENRTRNIMQALKPFKMLAVEPGEVVSFNKLARARTKENGYYEADEFLDGEITTGIGGGTCQASTTLMQALVKAGFTIDQRFQHSLRVSYCEPSQDATVTSSGKIKDLVFTNNTENTMYIFATCDWKEAKVEVYGIKPQYKIKLKTRTIQVKPWKGEEIVYKQNAKKAGQMVLKKEGVNGCITEGYRAYYDWDTGEHIEGMDETLWRDEYAAVKPVYYVYE